MSESETREEKSQFEGNPKEWLQLVKTIQAMANTNGGIIELLRVAPAKLSDLDSARLDGFVHKHIEPRIAGLWVDLDDKADIAESRAVIHVPDSSVIHITKQEGQYQKNGKHYRVFHAGQIWVRHAASNALATADDLKAMGSPRSEVDLIFGLNDIWSEEISIRGNEAAGMLHVPDLEVQVGAIITGSTVVENAVLSLGLFDSSNPKLPENFKYAQHRTVKYKIPEGDRNAGYEVIDELDWFRCDIEQTLIAEKDPLYLAGFKISLPDPLTSGIVRTFVWRFEAPGMETKERVQFIRYRLPFTLSIGSRGPVEIILKN